MTALRRRDMFALEAALHEEAMGWFKDCSTGLIRISWSHTENWMADHTALSKNLKLRICNHLWWHQNFLKLLHQKTLSKNKTLCDCCVKSAMVLLWCVWICIVIQWGVLIGRMFGEFACLLLLDVPVFKHFILHSFCENLFWQKNSFPTRLVIPVSSRDTSTSKCKTMWHRRLCTSFYARHWRKPWAFTCENYWHLYMSHPGRFQKCSLNT